MGRIASWYLADADAAECRVGVGLAQLSPAAHVHGRELFRRTAHRPAIRRCRRCCRRCHRRQSQCRRRPPCTRPASLTGRPCVDTHSSPLAQMQGLSATPAQGLPACETQPPGPLPPLPPASLASELGETRAAHSAANTPDHHMHSGARMDRRYDFSSNMDRSRRAARFLQLARLALDRNCGYLRQASFASAIQCTSKPRTANAAISDPTSARRRTRRRAAAQSQPGSGQPRASASSAPDRWRVLERIAGGLAAVRAQAGPGRRSWACPRAAACAGR